MPHGQTDAGDIIKALENSPLRGLGGAGFPIGRKWEFVRAEPGPRMMAVNADEGEPGTFKDRYHLETDPHRVLEGVLIGAWTVEAEAVYIYLRDEYPQCQKFFSARSPKSKRPTLPPTRESTCGAARAPTLRRRIGDARDRSRASAGCPGTNRPSLSQVGLFGRPTLINNVETLFWVRDIVEQGPEFFSKHGMNGRRACAISRCRAA